MECGDLSPLLQAPTGRRTPNASRHAALLHDVRIAEKKMLRFIETPDLQSLDPQWDHKPENHWGAQAPRLLCPAPPPNTMAAHGFVPVGEAPPGAAEAAALPF